MDKIARIILMKFFPNGLECPQNIPIEGKIIQAVGLNLIDYLSLSIDGTISGQMNFTDDIVNGSAKSVRHL